MSNGYVKFTGDYTKLKDMGFDFQKLFAANYMQWEKDGFRIWKKGGDITHDDFNLYEIIKFFRTQPEVKTYKWDDGTPVTHAFYKFYAENGKDYEFAPYTTENHERYGKTLRAWSKVTDDTPRDELPLQQTTMSVSERFLRQLEMFNELGLYELAERPKK